MHFLLQLATVVCLSLAGGVAAVLFAYTLGSTPEAAATYVVYGAWLACAGWLLAD